jgi:hypothetical protein
MRSMRLLVVAAILMFPMTNAFATCPDRQDIFLSNFFFFDTSCGSRSGYVSTTSQSCQILGADQFNVGSGSVDYSMTVPNDLSGSPWMVQIFVDFNDPSTYSLNGISASVTVVHNASVSHSEGFFFHNGNEGSLSCERFTSSTFSAYPGDTITVSYSGVNYTSGTTMKISAPTISFN